ncbi:MAG: UDP-N-acetylmuramate dehydrogenase [Rhodobacteraceae bacterium]|nr:UDP-N-acetylmuramate dehydrogenase [Paracoccaceae bacterium]
MTLDPGQVRGRLVANRSLADLTWLRVGGPADWVFQPEDRADLQSFLRTLPPEVPMFPMGVGSNLLVRDGGIRGVVLRLGRNFNEIRPHGTSVHVGAAALDAHVAQKAAAAGIDLVFLRTIPGTIGGAVRMNAGCYGTYMADVLSDATMITRQGEVITLDNAALAFGYRQAQLPEGAVLISARLRGPAGDPEALRTRMQAQLAQRDATQPVRTRTAGSVFRNPAGFSSTGRADDVHTMKAWKLIEAAGMGSARVGDACISPKHANFIINLGGATASDVEDLGERVRKKVLESSGIALEWEVIRIGDFAHRADKPGTGSAGTR